MAKWDHDDLKDKSDFVYPITVTNTPRTTREELQEAFERRVKIEADKDAENKARARGSDLQPQTLTGVRTFGTGATRDLDANKLDFEGFLSPLVLERYAQHMHKARKMSDGSMRASDNWQLGIPIDAYMKSMFRHFFDVWKSHRGHVTESDIETELCALLFNASGMLHEILKAKRGVQSN